MTHLKVGAHCTRRAALEQHKQQIQHDVAERRGQTPNGAASVRILIENSVWILKHDVLCATVFKESH